MIDPALDELEKLAKDSLTKGVPVGTYPNGLIVNLIEMIRTRENALDKIRERLKITDT